MKTPQLVVEFVAEFAERNPQILSAIYPQEYPEDPPMHLLGGKPLNWEYFGGYPHDAELSSWLFPRKGYAHQVFRTFEVGSTPNTYGEPPNAIEEVHVSYVHCVRFVGVEHSDCQWLVLETFEGELHMGEVVDCWDG